MKNKKTNMSKKKENGKMNNVKWVKSMKKYIIKSMKR